MKNRLKTIGLVIGILMGSIITGYAMTKYFTSESITSEFTKKDFFEIDLSTGLKTAEVAPGDSVDTAPAIYNDATESMYVFITVECPECDSEPIYEYEHDDNWTRIEDSEDDRLVYAYTGDSEECQVLMPGETTTPLCTFMKMKDITHAEYYLIDDINLTVTGYAIGVDDVDSDPETAWTTCKYLMENN